jgi:hypothetical protein
MFDRAGLFFLESALTKNTEEAAGVLAAELAALRMDIAHLAETMRELKEQQTQVTSLRAPGVFAGGRDKVASMATDAQNRVRSEIEGAIEHNPLTAALIAFIAGMWLGLPRRSRS